MTNFHIVTIFPELIDTYVRQSVLGRAIKNCKLSVTTYDPRDYVDNKWRQVDDRPFGGGPGMVMMAEPVIKAVAAAKSRKRNVQIFWLAPGSQQWTNETAASTAVGKCQDVIIICGRYEGIDARVKEVFDVTEVSVGPYVLTGGELPALLMVDSIARHIPEVLGHSESIEENRLASPDVYTRPETFSYKKKKYTAPSVLLSGDHKKIEKWRQDNRDS